MKNRQITQSDEKLKAALKQIQLRAQVQKGRTLTHGDLAELAGVSARSLGDWMRGIYAPNGMGAILELLSQLDESDVSAILAYWRNWRDAKQDSKIRKKGRTHKQVASVRKKASINNSRE